MPRISFDNLDKNDIQDKFWQGTNWSKKKNIIINKIKPRLRPKTEGCVNYEEAAHRVESNKGSFMKYNGLLYFVPRGSGNHYLVLRGW